MDKEQAASDIAQRLREPGAGVEWWNKTGKQAYAAAFPLRLHLYGMKLHGIDLQGLALEPDSNLREADLTAGDLRDATLSRVQFEGAILRNISSGGAHFENATLDSADLTGADFRGAHLQGANMRNATARGVCFDWSHLEGVNLGPLPETRGADLRGSSFVCATVDQSTLFLNCGLDEKVDFTGVSISSVRIAPPGDRGYLERNVREISWRKWYQKHALFQWLARPFWNLSNYGASTTRLVSWFCCLAIVFALIYYLLPGSVSGLHSLDEDSSFHSCGFVLRSRSHIIADDHNVIYRGDQVRRTANEIKKCREAGRAERGARSRRR